MVLFVNLSLKVEVSKKRANESATKTPIPAKKAKAATPQKTGMEFHLFFKIM